MDVDFSYSVTWLPTPMTLYDRRRLYESVSFFPKVFEIHWLAVINSVVLALLSTGLVLGILARIVHADFSRYARNASSSYDEDIDDYGWKQVYGDVFRFPRQKNLLAAVCGVGAQLLLLSAILLTLSLFGLFKPHHHGSMLAAAIPLYAATCFIGGYTSGVLYKMLGGDRWAWNIVLSASLFTMPFFLIWALLNALASSHQSTHGLPLTVIVVLGLVWLLGALARAQLAPRAALTIGAGDAQSASR